MPLPLIPIIWATTQYATIVAVVKGTVWSGARLVQHGFDYEATIAQLEKDLHATKEFGGAVGKLLPALAKLRLGNDFPDIVSAAYAIKRMLDSLPENFRTGLNKSTSFEARINQALEQALYRSGVSYLVHATSDTSANVSVRLHAFYFGLLLVSRSGNTLGAAEQAHAIDTLVQLHEKRNTQDDKTVIAAIKAFAHDQQSLAMHQHLFKAPEVWSMAEYDAPHMVLVRIAQALGDNCHIKLYDTPLVYLTTYFKENAHA